MKKILIIQTAFIGDVILATPLLEALHAHYPEARIDMLVRKGNQTLFQGHPFLKTVFVWDKQSGKYKNLLLLLIAIRRQKYDLVINCQRFAASGFLTAFSGAISTSGFRKNPFSFFFKHKVNHTISNGLHECARNLELIKHLNIKGAIQPRLYPAPLKFETPKDYSCIAPASVWFTKQWPKNKWIELINLIPSEQIIYLTGGPGDQVLCEEIHNSTTHPQVINLAGSLNLLESAELMRGATMNYVNDSAPMHLCSSVNAPVTAIFCSTVPSFGFGPLSENSRIIETKEELSCRPCGLHGFKTCPKGHFQCAESIMTENVLSK